MGTETSLLQLYIPLVGWPLLGWALGHLLPKVIPAYLGRFLFWVGVPFSIVGFLRGADLSGAIGFVPLIAWAAILLGLGLAWLWIRGRSWSPPTQGSFLLAAMVGNTGYLGFPVSLALVGPKYFAWALFYDMVGTTLGAYGLGAIMAAYFGSGNRQYQQVLQAMVKNPALWGFGLGMVGRNWPLPAIVENALHLFAWTSVALALVLIGMRLSQITSWQNVRPALVSLGIKMLVVPLLLGLGLSLLHLPQPQQRVIVLQMAMPPAFATLVLAEAYDLDRSLTVTALSAGSLMLLLTLPLWLWLF